MPVRFNVQVTFNKLPALKEGLSETVAQIIDEALNNLKDSIETSFLETKSGRMYGSHRASAPGEAPAIWTGDLADSLDKQKIGLSGSVSVSSPYAAYLEYGTSKMGARPYMAPAKDKLLDDLDGIVQDIFSKFLGSL